MNFELPPLGGQEGARPTSRQPQAATGVEFGSELSKAVSARGIPAAPPPEVLDEMGAAADVADRLAAGGRQLHFEPTSPGRVAVSLRDLNGNVLRALSPTEALDIASGTRGV